MFMMIFFINNEFKFNLYARKKVIETYSYIHSDNFPTRRYCLNLKECRLPKSRRIRDRGIINHTIATIPDPPFYLSTDLNQDP
jgi:hypothetical protein